MLATAHRPVKVPEEPPFAEADANVLQLNDGGRVFRRLPRHAAARARTDETNRLLKRFADAHPEIVWVDINAQLVDETGWVPRALMADEIHPTDAGYDIWMKALAPFL